MIIFEIGIVFSKGFVHLQRKNVFVAQLVEQLTLNQRVTGSSPVGDTQNKKDCSNVVLFC